MSFLKVSDLEGKVVCCSSPQQAFEFLQFAQANRFSFTGDSIGSINGRGEYYYMLNFSNKVICSVSLLDNSICLSEIVDWRVLRHSLPPRLCSILDVLPNEPFRIKDMSGNGPDCLYYINGDGTYETKPPRYRRTHASPTLRHQPISRAASIAFRAAIPFPPPFGEIPSCLA